ncbi:MAG TPA: ATP-binding protein [Bryobacteraceae bacterium]|nr:ATP-binding protein [Bryobacteraceae bacterium]
MLTFRDIPIKQKLMIIIMATTTSALLLAGVGIVAADSLLFRRDLRRDLSALAQMAAENSTAALAFNDPQVAAETLAALRARTHLAAACIYEPDGTVFAKYSRPDAGTGCPPADAQDQLRFTNSGLTVSRSIILSGRRVGTLVLLYDLDEISERMKLYGATVLGVLLVSSVIAFLLSSKLRAVIATPISWLVGATRSVSETGDYSVRAQKMSGDELGALVDRFNEMLAGIQSRDSNLRTALRDREEALRDAEKARERFRFLAESMPQKIFTATPAGDADYFNRQWTEFTGLPLGQIENWGWAQVVHPDDVEANVRSWRQSIETGEPFQFQHRFRRADGAYRWHLTRAHAMRDAEGNISMWIASNTDIHEQKEREEELRRANDDLQQFAYSASHDLQEPIRNVAVYSEIVAKRYNDLLDADGRQFLGFLTEGGRRLATLINDLLTYTRVGVIDGNMTAVDSSAALQHALSSVAEAIRENDATVTYDALPQVYMSESHLQQVFQNLIGNALKYRKEDRPQIRISAVFKGAAWRFAVQDNGIGIDSHYKEVIFGVFKRLHRDQKYSGTGIGLAICQRVVERYGGRIWVESSPGQGATFFFTVPEHAPRVHSAAV